MQIFDLMNNIKNIFLHFDKTQCTKKKKCLLC